MSETPRNKPLLRGVSHEIAAFVAFPAAIALFANAKSWSARLGAATYGASLFALFLISAVFHRPTWSPRARDLLSRVDNSAIFLLIAGTHTPLYLLIGGTLGHVMLGVIWTGALLGIGFTIAWPLAPKRLMAGIYVTVGWAFVPAVYAIRMALGSSGVALILSGGLVYTLGAVVYATRRPDPVPRVFGYHEVFHLLVIVGAALHFVAVRAAVGALG